jgi:hypothetical protein
MLVDSIMPGLRKRPGIARRRKKVQGPSLAVIRRGLKKPVVRRRVKKAVRVVKRAVRKARK